MRRVLRRLVVTCAFFVLAATPVAAQAAVKSIWGPVRLPNGASAFPTYRDLGVRDLQMTLSWQETTATRPQHPRDPNDPAYRWPADVDRAVAEAGRYGISISLRLIGTPPWANRGRSWQWAPTHSADFGAFATAAAKRYLTVHRWMVWSEPNRHGAFQPVRAGDPSGPRRYAQLLDAAYGALKQASRRNTVIGGMTYTSGDIPTRQWLRWLRLPNGKRPRLDWWGHNPYSTRFPDLRRKPYNRALMDFSDLDTLHSLLHHAFRGRSTPKLWLSEFSIQSDHGSKTFNWFVSRNAQAQWLTAAYRIANQEPWIAGMGWLGLMDEPDDGAATNEEWGLMTAAGARKPAYYAYRRVR